MNVLETNPLDSVVQTMLSSAAPRAWSLESREETRWRPLIAGGVHEMDGQDGSAWRVEPLGDRFRLRLLGGADAAALPCELLEALALHLVKQEDDRLEACETRLLTRLASELAGCLDPEAMMRMLHESLESLWSGIIVHSTINGSNARTTPIAEHGPDIPIVSAAGREFGRVEIPPEIDAADPARARRITKTAASLVAAAADAAHLYQDLLNTHQKLTDLQSRLVQTGRLAGVGQLAAGISHEVNNPLQVLAGRIQILRMKLPEDHAGIRDLEIMQHETERITRVIRNLGDFARMEKDPHPRPVNIHWILNSVVDLLQHRIRWQQIVVVWELECDHPEILGHADQLRQLFLNLCLNSLQALQSEEGGQIVLRTSGVNDRIEVEVEDNGPGIAVEHLDKLFDPFFTPRNEGSGLGLAVGWSIARRHGGSLDLVLRPDRDRGACFRVTLGGVSDLPGTETPTPSPNSPLPTNLDPMP